MKAFIRATLIAVLALISFSCGDYEEEELTSFEKFSGKTWSSINEGTYTTTFKCYQFNSNGTFKYWYLNENGYSYSSDVRTGKWSIIESEEEGVEDKVKIQYDNYYSYSTYNISTFLSGLTRNNSSSDIAEYKKLAEEYYY